MSGSKLFAATIPPISPELFDALKKAFPRIEPEPNHHTIEDIMFNAGQLSVVYWLQSKIRGSTVQGSYDIKQAPPDTD